MVVNEKTRLVKEQVRWADDLEEESPFDWRVLKTYTRERVLLGLAFSALVISTAGERFIFKFTVDRMEPFRLVLNIVVLMMSMVVYGVVAITKRRMKARGNFSGDSSGFPHAGLIRMATLDALQFSGLVVSAAGVSPTMTVILLHANTPFVVLGSRIMFDGREYSLNQMRGVCMITVAVMISFVRPVYHWYRDDNVPFVTSSFSYVFFTAVQGFAMLYKEKCIIEYGKPLDVHELSFWLFLYQLLITILISPAIYLFQGVSSRWDGFPISSFFTNINDGFHCILGRDPSIFAPYDTEYCNCESSLLLILSYSVFTILALFCVDTVLQLGNQALGRAMFLGVFFAIIILSIYDTISSFGDGYFGSDIGLMELFSFACLLTGMETYYYDPEPDGQVMTAYIPSR